MYSKCQHIQTTTTLLWFWTIRLRPPLTLKWHLNLRNFGNQDRGSSLWKCAHFKKFFCSNYLIFFFFVFFFPTKNYNENFLLPLPRLVRSLEKLNISDRKETVQRAAVLRVTLTFFFVRPLSRNTLIFTLSLFVTQKCHLSFVQICSRTWSAAAATLARCATVVTAWPAMGVRKLKLFSSLFTSCH